MGFTRPTPTIAILCGGLACSGAPTGPRELTRSAHFRVVAGVSDSAVATSMRQALENNYARIVSDLRSDSLPMISLTLYRSHDDLERAVRPIIVPSWASGLATAQDQIHLMSP